MFHDGRATVLALVALALSACGSVDGRYENANGGITLSLKGGKGEFAMMGEVAACTYEVKKGDVLLNCAEFEGPVTLKHNDDGTLSSPFGPLARKGS